MGDCVVVTQVTSFSRNGLSDWLLQRVSALILLAYFLFIGVQIATGIDYTSWRTLHDTTAMKVFTLLAIGAYVSHAWIGNTRNLGLSLATARYAWEKQRDANDLV